MSKQNRYPEELAQEDQHFASGVNAPGEVRGLALSGRHVGITATHIRDGLLEELAQFAGGMLRLFVDSGAFSEVAFGPEGPKVVKEITDADWQRRLGVYRWAAAAYRGRALLVAPDRVGCQETTLARLRRYAADMQVCASAGANIIVPVQKGARPMSQMWREAVEILGLRNLIAGVPMKKDATSLEDLAELVDSLPRSRPTETRQGARIHLLGLGPESPRFREAVELIKRLRPHAQITSDSVTIRRLVGRTNGPKGGPRALTAAQDRARSRGVSDAQEVKAVGLIDQGFAEIDADRKRAHELGWYDEELYDSLEEAKAHHAELHPELYQDQPPAPAPAPAPAPQPQPQAAKEPKVKPAGKGKRNPVLRTWLDDAIIADNFAGGGGASSGIEAALGRSPDIAVNHDPEAIAMHAANHPSTRHYIENVWQIDPKKASGGKPVGLAWFSPTCTHFSKAKGTALDEESVRIRGLAWIAIRWAAAVKPRVIMLENVEEFEKWGPLHRDHTDGCEGIACVEGCRFGKKAKNPRGRSGRISKHSAGCPGRACIKECRIYKPIKAREGETFRAFVKKLGRFYRHVEWRQLRACDYGAPTTRRRLFLQASNEPIRWPEPTHGPGRQKPHRTAAEVIDWSIPCPSIFDREKPLADKTLARIARGIRKFVLDNPRPFIVPAAYGDKGGSDVRVNDVEEPLRTICGHRGGHAIVTPMLMKVKSYGGGGNDAKPASSPLGTVTASKRGEFAIAVPYLVHRSNGERGELVGDDGKVHPGQQPRVYDVRKPLGTVVAQGQKHAACVALLIKHNGGNNDEAGSSGQPVTEPMHTLATKNTKSLTLAHLVRYNSEQSAGSTRGQEVSEPVSTIDTANRLGLVASHLVKLRGTSEAHLEASSHAVDEPVPTISASGTHIAQVAAFLVRYNGESTGQRADAPIGTVDTTDRYGLITVQIDGEDYVVADIGMRMLTPRELFRAQGFADDYEIAPSWNGKPLSKTAQIRMVGNSVCPPLAAAIVRAHLGIGNDEQPAQLALDLAGQAA